MKTKSKIKKILLSLYHYLCFFLLMAFLISCCMTLFLSIYAKNIGIAYTEKNIKTAAVLTFWNVAFLSLVCTVIDAVRRKLTVDRPVKTIVNAAEQIAKGDYSVRIPEIRSINRADGLDEIISCYNRMAKQLSATETLQKDFIANVSHELKTPLSVMQNYATLLQRPDISDEERIRYAKSVSEASKRLANLITNILKLNKLENQEIHPKASPFNLSEQLCLCLLDFENIWEEKDISIETDIADDVIINADTELLTLVWNNLFSNAFKFTEKGGSVHISLKAEDNSAVVSVKDSGCGIDCETGKHIFEKFYQGDTSHSTQGNGLGLALVKRVIDIVDGDIFVSSEVGKGSTFTVKLKVK